MLARQKYAMLRWSLLLPSITVLPEDRGSTFLGYVTEVGCTLPGTWIFKLQFKVVVYYWTGENVLCYQVLPDFRNSVPFLEVAQPAPLGPSSKNSMEMKMNIEQCCPKVFAHGPLLASKNNHGSLHRWWCKYSVSGSHNSELILDSCEYILLALHNLILIKIIVACFVGSGISLIRYSNSYEIHKTIAN
jgi:hypothetical protein